MGTLTSRFRYEVLSDSNKRSLYDQMGKAGLESGGGMGGGMDPQDLFSQLFGGGGGFFGGGGGESLLDRALEMSSGSCHHRRPVAGPAQRQRSGPPHRRFTGRHLQGQSAEACPEQISDLQDMRRTRWQERLGSDLYRMSRPGCPCHPPTIGTHDAADPTTMWRM